MKHIVTIEVPATTKEVVTRVTCDICHKDIHRNTFDVDEVEIKHRTGYTGCDCGNVKTTSIDMCGECFNTKLVPWLHSQGVDPRVDEHIW